MKFSILSFFKDGTQEKELQNLRSEVEQLKEKCQDQQKQIREQCETIRMLERTNKQLEIDNETLAYKVKFYFCSCIKSLNFYLLKNE